METGKLRVGQLVWSTKGRDSGRLYVIIGFLQDRVLVADGKIRRVHRPKKKNARHLKVLPVVVENIRSKIEQGRKPSDADIQRALRSFEEGGSE
ncbi:MAG: RNA-binding protein [Peptococcaceae bacterium]|nr:RNA-binding protein [Peptococcaceae bacterium]